MKQIRLIKDFKILSQGLIQSGDLCEYSRYNHLETTNDWCHINLGYFIDGKVVGELQIKMVRSVQLTGCVINIFVDKKFRKQGVGSKLLTDAIRRCKEDLGCYFIKAMISQVNIASIKLFKKFNFEYSGTYPDKLSKGKLILFENYYKYIVDCALNEPKPIH
tara:strand:- start:52441 stop:52926 length:486 start_codon:yes stop_codon:yes gene_type:complete